MAHMMRITHYTTVRVLPFGLMLYNKRTNIHSILCEYVASRKGDGNCDLYNEFRLL